MEEEEVVEETTFLKLMVDLVDQVEALVVEYHLVSLEVVEIHLL